MEKVRDKELKQVSESDARKFVEEHYEPVEDKPGYVWLSKRNMRTISIDLLVTCLKEWERSNSNKGDILSYHQLLAESEVNNG